MFRGFFLLLAITAFSPLVLHADLSLVHPNGGETITQVPECQRLILALPTYEKRIELLRADRANKCARFNNNGTWMKGEPLILKWKPAKAEGVGLWKIEIGKKRDLSDARCWYAKVQWVEANKGTGDWTVEYEVPYANLEIGTTFYWRVTQYAENLKVIEKSAVGTFKTADIAPRWINIRGRAVNIRDLGGRKTADGKFRVKQGMLYRGQGLNDNSVTGEKAGENRLTATDIEYFTKTLGIRTDLDLRGILETADLDVSPLGPSVKLVKIPSAQYYGLFVNGKKSFAEDFRLMLDEANYPIYFHCIAGADRTGTLAYVLNGLLGVERGELEADWELTMYPHSLTDAKQPEFRDERKLGIDRGLMLYGDENTPWNKRIELFVLSTGITPEEIEKFRAIMLEPVE